MFLIVIENGSKYLSKSGDWRDLVEVFGIALTGNFSTVLKNLYYPLGSVISTEGSH